MLENPRIVRYCKRRSEKTTNRRRPEYPRQQPIDLLPKNISTTLVSSTACLDDGAAIKRVKMPCSLHLLRVAQDWGEFL